MVLNPLLFTSAMDAPIREARDGLPLELLYPDDLVLVAESIGELKEKSLRWKEYMERKGSR